MTAPILIWGAGAIGGILGAFLVRAGHEVLFVDIDADHVAAMNAEGLRIEGPLDAFSVPAKACLPQDVEGLFDTVFLCVKGHHTGTAAMALKDHLTAAAAVVSAQNGLCEPLLCDIVGGDKVVGCFVNYAGDYYGPGRVMFGNRGKVAIGELDGRSTERARQLRDLLAVFEPEAELTDNIYGYLWAKLAYGTMLFATALSPLSMAENLDRREFRPVFIGLAREVMATARAEGVTPLGFNGFVPEAYMPDAPDEITEASLEALVAFTRQTAKTHSGIWRDIAVRKRPTEVDMQVGAVIAHAERLGVEVPLCRRLHCLIKQLEAGRSQRPELIGEIALQAA